MPRPRKPTKLHILTGTAKKHPERMRARENEPVPTGSIGEAPKHLTKEQAACWDELVALIPPGVAYCSDRPALELTTKLMVQFRTDPTMTAANQRHLINLLGKFGLTPSDRSRVAVPPGDGANPFGKFR